MDINQALGSLSSLMRIAAIVLALAALAKIFGVIAIRGSTMELAAIAIALALAK